MRPAGFPIVSRLRTGAEIAAWSALDETTRLHFMDVVLPARAERRQTP